MKWPMVELGSVAEVSSGDGAPQEASAFGKSGTPFIRAGSLSPLLDGVSENELELIPVHEASRRRMRTYPPRTIVFAKSGMSCTKGLIYEIKSPSHVVNHLAALECGGDLDNRFLLRWFEANSPSRLIANPSYPSIKISDIRSEKIPLPPLAEQKRIAAILDAADALRAKRREALAQLDALLQSTFLNLFGDPVTNPMGWEMVTVGSEVDFLTSGSRGWAQYYSDVGDVFIRIQNLRGGVLDLSDIAYVNAPDSAEAKRTKVAPGDVLLSITADLGRTAVVPDGIGKAHINQHLAILRFRSMNPTFVSHQIASAGCQTQFVTLNRAAVKAGLNFNDVRSIRLTNPPLPLQQKFAAIVESVERQKTTQRAHLAELDALFAALQHRAFRGEL